MAASEYAPNRSADACIGLMTFFSRFEPEYVLRYQQWHNCEHMRERVGLPGFETGRRYRLWSGEPWFLMMYDGDEPAVFSSPEYKQRLDNPTEWTREALPQFRDALRNVYRKLGSFGASPAWPDPYLLAIRFNVDEDPELLEQIRADWLYRVSAMPQVSRARLYALEDAASTLSTKERSLHGSGPGQERFLALIECTVPELQKAANWPAHPPLEVWRDENFWIEFALDKNVLGQNG